MTKEITVKNLPINVKISKENDDFICLTDMAKFKGEETGLIIANWLTTKYTMRLSQIKLFVEIFAILIFLKRTYTSMLTFQKN
jgi:hypothetical protein